MLITIVKSIKTPVCNSIQINDQCKKMYLNAHSYFSLRYGTLSPEALVAAAKDKGISTLVLTDINNTSCAYAFIQSCKQHGIKPVLGIEFRQGGSYLYTGIARNNKGFFELNRLLTDCSLDDQPLPEIAPKLENCYFIYTSLPKRITEFSENEFFGIRPKQVNKLFNSGLREHQEKLVVFSPITCLDENGYKLHQLLRAIDLNTVITKLKPKDCARPREYIYPPQKLESHFQNYPAVIENTKRLLANCSINLASNPKHNRQSFTGSKSSDMKLLCKLANNGCIRRYGEKNKEALERVEKELKVIEQLDFASYFLITWDIIRYAQTSGYYHIGRGSGANSIIAFCLYITDVDPLELNLFFERFINPYRSSPPDFDIDFSWDERDDVTDYIFKRYGREHTALLATYSTFKGKSIIRELGKVFGLPKQEIDRIVNEPLNTNLHHDLAEQIFKYGKIMEGFPNYLSIHAGGILITEEPINNFTALQMMPKGFPITHFDMYGAEDLALHKFDILSQRGIGHIKESVELIGQNKGDRIDIHNIEKIKNDKKVKSMLYSGHCIGCFYIESPAMRGLLSKLGCDNYVHLVAASSIIRPGVSKSGMMREYIKRFHEPEKIKYLHPIFEEQLGETFGVMVYQEDVMKICHHFSGLALDESDVLRRIMTGKRKSSEQFKKLEQKYFHNCREKGYPEALTQEVWRQIESFSGYSFCKAHSASFAVESFQSLYLKSYYPLEFMVAVINNFGGFYNTELYIHEARMQGGNIHAPCINHSKYLTAIYDDNIYIGLVHIHKLERRVAHALVLERSNNGAFLSMEDFVLRVDISQEQLEILIRIGAFRFTGLSKYELMWEKNAVFNPSQKRSQTGQLFRSGFENFELPKLEEGRYDQAFDEIELLGFALCSPFDLLEEGHSADIVAREMKSNVGKTVRMLGYYVTKKNVTTSNKRLMNFGTWLDSNGRFFDSVHFPPSLEASPFRGKGCYLITGKIVLDFEFPMLEVIKMIRLPFVADERY